MTAHEPVQARGGSLGLQPHGLDMRRARSAGLAREDVVRALWFAADGRPAGRHQDSPGRLSTDSARGPFRVRTKSLARPIDRSIAPIKPAILLVIPTNSSSR